MNLLFKINQRKAAALLYVATVITALFTSCKKDDGGSSFPGGAKKLTYTGSTEALSEGRSNMQVYQTGNYTCFTGGVIYSLPVSTTGSINTDVYNKQSGAWSRYSMSIKRDYYAAGALNNKLLIAGGTMPNYGYSKVVDVFDLATGLTTITQLSEPRSYLAAAAAGNKILFAGGYLDGNNKVSARVDIYNTQTGQWTIDSLSLARGLLSAGAVGNKIVFAGGVAINNSNGQGYNSNRVDIYDVQTGQWTQATLSQPRSAYNAISVITAGNKLLIAGGATTSNTETVDVYDAQTNLCTTINLTGNTLTYMLACSNGEQIFLTSGSTFLYTHLHTYNAQNGQMNVVPLPVPIRISAMTVAGNKVVIAAGIIDYQYTDKVFVYDTQTRLFDTTGFKLPKKKINVTAASAGNKLLFAGGVIDEQPAGQPRRVENFKTVSVFELK